MFDPPPDRPNPVPETKHDMNLVKLIEQYGSEDKCRAWLEQLRWPEGVECPRCESRKISRIVKRNQFDCDSCRYQFSVTAGTLFHDSHLPLWKWFLAIYMMVESKKGISANQLKRTLNVSYKTAWYLCHRIRDAMGSGDEPLLKGIVEMDETYVGGKVRGKGKGYKDNKSVVVGAVQRDGQVRIKVLPTNSREHLWGFLREHVADDTIAVYTDEHPAYQGGWIEDDDTRHAFVQHRRDEWVRGEVHTNTVENVWSLFKRSVIGTYHYMSVKHLPAYVDELEFRFNNRHNPLLFRDTMTALLHDDPLTYKALTARKGVKRQTVGASGDDEARKAYMREAKRRSRERARRVQD